MCIKQINEEKNKRPKINIHFRTTQNIRHSIAVNLEITIGQLLNKYLILAKRKDLIDDKDKSSKIVFLNNSYKLRFEDKTPVGEFFKGQVNPTIIVNEIQNLCGGNPIL